MKKRSVLFLIMCFLPVLTSAKQFYFKKYQVETGLSHNTVWCSLQDSYGFMWFGTSDGLNWFDGKKFKIYRNDIKDKSSLGNNFVQTLFEDDDHNIWIGTNSGVYIYRRMEDKFTHFRKETEYGVFISSEVKKIIRTSNGKLWIATLGQGIFIYDKNEETLVQTSQHTSFVWDIYEDKMHRVYSSSLQEGLICYDLNGKYIESFTSFIDRHNMENLKINCIRAIDDKIWFSIGTNNLSMLDTKTKHISYYRNNNWNIGTVRAITEFSETELFIGSDNGLYLFNRFTEQFLRVDNPVDSRSLSNHSVFSILKDVEGGFWITTYIGGVNYLAPQTKVFEYFSPADSELSTSKVINRFCEMKDMNILAASQDGLKILYIDTQKLESYPLPGKIKKPDIRALLLDNDNLWIGTYAEGLKILNLKTHQVTEHYHIRESTQTICSNDVLSLFKDKKGDIYVGTSWGLCRYNWSRGDFETLNFVGSMTSVFDIMEDRKGYLWIATDNSGVFRYDSGSQWKHYFYEEDKPNSIVSNSINTLFEDSGGRIWVGSNGAGLCYYNEDSETFSDFDPQNKILPNKVIYSIEEDNAANLWISTNAGLLRMNPSDASKLKLFTKEYGLQSNQFNFKASLKSSTGKLYFGGINGFNAFYPNDFEENTSIPPVYIVDIRLYNTNERETGALLNLSSPIYIARKVSLPYNNNSVAFEFAALSYEELEWNKYKYMLSGFDRDWVNSGNSSLASYTNLPPGEYIFRVKGANNDGHWNENEADIQLIILPPWWRSTFAYVAYFIAAVFAVYFLVKYLTLRSRKRFRLQLESYRVEKEKEVYSSKIRFFINLVHEIKTPLTLIKLPLEMLNEERPGDSKVEKYLNIINKNVSYLLNVVDQLLDFQKIENQSDQLILKGRNLGKLLSDIHSQFVQAAELNHIRLSLTLPEEEIIVPVDKEKIVKIITNLLSNAFKFTKTKIELRLEYFGDRFCIRVIDDGPGIPDEEKDKVFEVFYQINEENAGTGIGLAFSKSLAQKHEGNLSIEDNAGGGSAFVLSIPVTTENEGELLRPDEPEEENPDVSEDEEYEPDIELSLNYTILLAEDNVELLNMLEESLKPYYFVLKSQNGKKALEILARETVDIVVSDVMMPKMGGLELCKIIKTNIEYSHIPIILLTAKSTLDSKIEGLEYGAEAYIEKPFSFRYLHKQIDNLLKLRLSIRQSVQAYPLSNSMNMLLSPKDQEFIQKLQSEISIHLDEPEFSIDSIAETLFMSRSSFYRKLKRVAGTSPVGYLKMVRMNKAAELLLKDGNIIDICERVGFGSSSYFARCFKDQFGMLPRQYIKAHKE